MENISNDIAETIEKSGTLPQVLDVIFKNYPDAILFKDKNFLYKSINPVFCKLLNFSDNTIFLDKSSAEFLTKENAKMVQEVNRAVKRELKTINFILNDADKIFSVTSCPITLNNEFLGIVTAAKDITHEENIKERFVLKHYQLKSLLENIPMLIYMQDKNHNFISGTKFSQNFVKDGLDPFSNTQINRAVADPEEKDDNNFVIQHDQILSKEKELLDNRGNPHWYKVYKVPIKDFNNNVTGVITLINNIDAEKQLQAQRETFVASIGHDLKNPTIAQMRGLELLLNGDFGDLNKEQTELVEMILDSCRYMNGMLASLLATYRDNDGAVRLHFEEISLPDLVMECVSEMIYVAKDKDVNIYINNQLGEKFVQADRVQVKRVIMNLLSNGIKYAYKGTTLALNVYLDGSKTCFEFENESPYIPKNMQQEIFAQYVSFASSHKELGIGLGLYASKKIIEAHSGKIYVQSEKNQRNKFGFKIPTKQKNLNEPIEVCF